MIIKYLYIFIFAFVINIGFAQETFSDKSLEGFVNVYMTFKTEKTRNNQVDKIHFEKYGVSPQRYKEIFGAALKNDEFQLSPNESKLMAEIKSQNELLQKTNKDILQKLCEKFNISKIQYDIILNKYKKELSFQRSLKPQFDSYIKRLK